MKIVFNYLFWLGLMVSMAAFAPSAEADSTFFTKRSVLSSFFPKSDKVSFKKFEPTKLQREALKRQLGYELSKSSYYFFVATTQGKSGTVVDGYAFIDDVMGQHKPITFAVKLSRRTQPMGE